MTRSRAPTPAEEALARAGLTVAEAARHLERSPRHLARQLAANHVPCHGLARQLAALCGCGIWVFHPISLARERERGER
jgi:hypothetical protein